MDNRGYKTGDFLFFGAGRVGRYWLEYCKDFGIIPKGMIDNNLNLHGSQCEGITIYNPDDLKNLSFDCIFITCNNEEEISNQLLECGVESHEIVTGWHNILNHFFYYGELSSFFLENIVQVSKYSGEKKILFDLQNGMVLGGVEIWTYGIAKKLKAVGYKGIYFTVDIEDSTVADWSFPILTMPYKNISSEKERVILCMKNIIENLPCTIICNFPQNIFWAACIVKRLFPNSVRIIAVQHSDDSLYYEAYSLWKDYIDQCMVISSRIEGNLLRAGLEQDKLSYLEWEINCEEKLSKRWSMGKSPLRIGYAGRLTMKSKRVDLLPVLADKLRKRDVLFQISIAGLGEYEEILRQEIEEKDLGDSITFTGYISQSNISDFWRRQDIMVSCSEREGHSISQSEAMAEGAVPVVTDVSGARDDVTDGYNGYIVPVGNVEALADRICYLYSNKGLLRQMGERAHDTIYQRQRNQGQTAFWEKVLRKVWQ